MPQGDFESGSVCTALHIQENPAVWFLSSFFIFRPPQPGALGPSANRQPIRELHFSRTCATQYILQEVSPAAEAPRNEAKVKSRGGFLHVMASVVSAWSSQRLK